VYPQVTQFTTRRREIACQLKLIRERRKLRASAQGTADETARGVRGSVALALRLLVVLCAVTLAGLAEGGRPAHLQLHGRDCREPDGYAA
jgi:hypothetical protein